MGDSLEKAVKDEVVRVKNLPKSLLIYFLVASIFGIVLAIFYLFGFTIRGEAMLPTTYYFLLMAAYLPSVFLILPARKKEKIVPWYDLLMAASALGLCLYFFAHAWHISEIGWYPPTISQFILGLIFCLLILEGARRIAGLVYASICIFFGLYPLFAHHMPGILFGHGFSLFNTVSIHAFSSEGIIGLSSKIIGEILLGFLLFAGILIGTGAGTFFLNLAQALLGRFRGGPAKVAVVASGFFGSLSGSALSNVVATGSVTIPAMKRLGYPAHYAGAIEACASTGGVLMPPVMGVVVFIMAALLGIEYAVIISAAAIPSILYYFGLLMQVDAYAARVGLKGLPREEIPSIKKTLKAGWPYIAVLLFLIWGLLYMRWETRTPFYASGATIILSYYSRETMLTPRKFIDAIVVVATLIIQTMALILPISFILAGLTRTGTSASFTAGIITLGGENLFLILVIGVVACYILGMAGLLSAAYIFLAVTLAPSVIQIGKLNVLAVHLFIVYYAMLALITPPVANAAFLGAAISGAPPMKTALQAMRLGVVIYFIPFFFIFNPALILQGPVLDALYLFALCLLGILFIAAGLEGYLVLVGTVGWLVRLVLVFTGLLIAFPEWKTTIIGAAIALFAIAVTLIRRKEAAKALIPTGYLKKPG